jgi:hypothetical protein
LLFCNGTDHRYFLTAGPHDTDFKQF